MKLKTIMLTIVGLTAINSSINACTSVSCSQYSVTSACKTSDCKVEAATCNAASRLSPTIKNPTRCHKCSWKNNVIGGICK